MKEFIQKLEKIDLPNQLVAVMGDRLLQKLLQLKSSDTVLRRVDNWLLAFFEDQLEESGSSESRILEMLAAVRDYTNYTKVGVTDHFSSWMLSLVAITAGLSGVPQIHDSILEWHYWTTNNF